MFSATAFALTFLLGTLVKSLLNGAMVKKAVLSPLKTLLPTLSEDEQQELPYPPDALPSARDVQSPYGSMRVYEWGPLDGKKVLLVHGISTPCIALGAVAHSLVDRGCRVMTFDL